MNDLHGVRRTPEGFVPYCRTCDYEGKARPADQAEAALRQHRHGSAHARECRRATFSRS
jgi:hypothetical protein